MGIVTPGIIPASELLGPGAAPAPAWLARWTGFAADLTPADLPAAVVERTKLVLLDSLGVIAAGLQEPECRALAERLAARRPGPAPAPGSGLRLDPRDAALVNGCAGTALELDEGNQYARGHPAIHVVPAALAAAQDRGTGGPALLAAIALGYEIGARIGIASRLAVAMHPHGTWGTVGAALAVARLNGADAAGIGRAAGIAATLGLATSRRTMLEGATIRNAYAGFSNQLGLTAWDLAESGFLPERDGIATVYGSVIAEGFSAAAMIEDLGTRWEIARNYFKRHAACRYTHAALDALARIRAEAGPIDPGAVRAVEVATYVWAAQFDHPAPATMLAAKFSLPYTLAAALMRGEADVAAFRPEARADPRILALARRVSVREDPAMTARLPAFRPARVTLSLADGRRLSAEVETNRGDTEDPYAPEEVRAKFRALAGPVWGSARADRIAAAVAEIDRAADLGPLLALIA
ncbi:MmgE/PrpD family protein [Methylobacterium sp. 4-46]|uniref:MmgE/PrpD family protein n=1 Tax=unclassified Methylobacterium TaxID=2615210 RepID=UPI000152D97C|nr:MULTISPECIES: MmgE/PrpD family protein [Methylobacterium]ACA16401.1 MmgE/PrpD family protein [Methylobacterium sp. 4-46]WFT82112.1 MmgE/PrpD family protein [Methylobacterium nodulans]